MRGGEGNRFGKRFSLSPSRSPFPFPKLLSGTGEGKGRLPVLHTGGQVSSSGSREDNSAHEAQDIICPASFAAAAGLCRQRLSRMPCPACCPFISCLPESRMTGRSPPSSAQENRRAPLRNGRPHRRTVPKNPPAACSGSPHCWSPDGPLAKQRRCCPAPRS